MNAFYVFLKIYRCSEYFSAIIALVSARLPLESPPLNSGIGAENSFFDELVISCVEHHVDCQTLKTKEFFSASLAVDRLTSFSLGVLSFTISDVREMVILVTEEKRFASGAELFPQ